MAVQMFIDFKLESMRKSLLFTILLIVTSAFFYETRSQQAISGLVQAERDFAAYCAKNGLPEAWVEYFSADGLVFVPHPKNAHEDNNPKIPSPKPPPITLHWEPYHGAVSAGGDLGFNTGPWKISSGEEGADPSYGYFFSVWKKQPSGEWKVLLDLGVSAPIPGPEHVFGAAYDQRHTEADNGKSKATSLAEADYLFNARAATSMEAAYQKLASTSILSTISGVQPFYNKRSLLSWLSADGSPFQKASAIFSTIDSGVAVSQDMGYSYGSYEIDHAMNEKGYYIRIWRKNPDGYWYLTAEVLSDNVKARS